MATGPTVAVINTAEDVILILSETLAAEGFRPVAGYVADFRDGRANLAAFLRAHEPAVILWDIAVPYAANWQYVQDVRAGGVMQDCPLVLTTTNKRALEALVGPTPTIELVGRPFDLDTIVAADGTVQYASPSVRRVLGYDPAAQLGVNVVAFIHPEDAERVQQSFLAAQAEPGRHQWIEFRLRHADGSWRTVEAASNVLFHEPSVAGVVVNLRDITERRQAEAERERLADAERAARQAAVHARSELLASLSHDLKNPLAAIKGTAQLLARRLAQPDPPPLTTVQEGVTSIDRLTTQVEQQLAELVDLARLEVGAPLRLACQPLDLVALVRQVVASYQATTDRHALQVDTDRAELVGEWDGPRLARALANLVANAIKYSPQGGRITVRVAPVLPSAAPDPAARTAAGRVQVSVQDAGVGIPGQDLAHVFDRFHRGRNVIGRLPGLGLGLAGVKQIVEQHGCVVRLDSREGVGTTVTVELPLVCRSDA